MTAGHLIVILLHWDNYPYTGDATVSDGSSTFAYGNTVQDALGIACMRLAYCLSSVASGTVTYTGTFPGTSDHWGIDVMEYSGNSLSLDNSNLGATGTGSAAASQNFSTTGTAEVVFGGVSMYAAVPSFSSPLIGGAAADQSIYNYVGFYRGGALWSKIATVSSSNASITSATGYNWTADAISFKEGGGASASLAGSFRSQATQTRKARYYRKEAA